MPTVPTVGAVLSPVPESGAPESGVGVSVEAALSVDGESTAAVPVSAGSGQAINSSRLRGASHA